MIKSIAHRRFVAAHYDGTNGKAEGKANRKAERKADGNAEGRMRMKMSSPQVGSSAPLGAAVRPDGVNFSVFSKHATAIELLLFDDARGGAAVADRSAR